MLFRNPPKLGSRIALNKYLEADLFSWMKNLTAGFLRLTFLENFECFRIDSLLMPVGVQVPIPNLLQNSNTNAIPTSWIIVRQQATGIAGNTGNGLVVEGLDVWTSTVLYLYNNGPQDCVISVIFFK